MTGGIILRDAENLKHFEEKLKLRTAKFDGKWISYERNTGKWSFEVSHFSKYGLDDDEEEGDVTTNNTNQTKPVPAQSAPTAFKHVYQGLGMEVVEPTNEPQVILVPDENFDDDDYMDENDKPARLLSTQLEEFIEMKDSGHFFSRSSNYDEEDMDDTITSRTSIPQVPGILRHISSTPRRVDKDSLSYRLPIPEPIHDHQKLTCVPINQSVCATEEISETKVFNPLLHMSRSFRAGWGPGGVLIVPQPSTVSNVRLDLVETRLFQTDNELTKLYEEHLTTHEKRFNVKYDSRSNTTVVNQNVEFVSNDYSESLKELISKSHENKELNNIFKYIKELWDLVSILYERPILKSTNLYDDNLKEEMDQLTQRYRSHSLNLWFKKVLDDDRPSDDKSVDFITRMFDCLTRKKVEKAAQIALESGNPRLSLMLTQVASRNPLFWTAVEKQVNIWRKAVDSAHPFHQIMDVISGEVMELCKSLDWRRSVAVVLWYDRRSTVSGLLDTFENSDDIQTNYPRPSYIRDDNVLIKDLIYNTLSYHYRYGQRYEKDLREMFLPDGWTSNPLDFGLTWFLYNILYSLEKLPFDINTLYSITIDFAFQLEMIGKLDSAIYVLLTLPNEYMWLQERAIKNIINRHIELISTHEILKHNIFEKYGIPLTWFYEALASYEHVNLDNVNDEYNRYNQDDLDVDETSNFYKEVEDLIMAGEYYRAYGLLLDYVGSDSILSSLISQFSFKSGIIDASLPTLPGDKKKLELLNQYILTIKPHISTTEWKSGGSLFQDFMLLLQGSCDRNYEDLMEEIKKWSNAPPHYPSKSNTISLKKVCIIIGID
eukprot:TRINITY_DN2169_c0_g2_i3.p1 TRINITY_DN2169_c0_g2~~TRINITY_DN2169_c0_g2_i3.p1  ORF type:complete len:828 (+),score=188.04 TRINITY_DN2169_c0_g2_i3:198-2681(+)